MNLNPLTTDRVVSKELQEEIDSLNKKYYVMNKMDLYKEEKLSEEFLEHFQHTYTWRIWHLISIYQTLSESFMEKYKDKLYWGELSHAQVLSEEFIEKHADKVLWSHIFKYQKVSPEFKEKYKHKIL